MTQDAPICWQRIKAAGPGRFRLRLSTRTPRSGRRAGDRGAAGAAFLGGVMVLFKQEAYRWNPEQKVWHTRLDDEAQLTAELEWLRAAVYGGRMARVQVEKMDADVKYSSRAGVLSNREI